MTASNKTKRKKNNRRRRKTRIRPWVWVACAILTALLIVIPILMEFRPDMVPLYEDVAYPRTYSEYVEKYAQEYGVEENLVYAVIKTESGFQPDAVSENNAKGLMQITEETFDWISWKLGESGQYVHDDLYDPELCIRYGTYFLGYLIDEFDGYTEVLAAYHAGRSAVNDWLDNPEYSSDGVTLDYIPYDDTAHYVTKVLNNYSKYTQIYREENQQAGQSQ